MAKKNWLTENLLLTITIGSVFVGVILGFIVRTQQPSLHTIMLLSFPGEMLMNMLKMLIMPLVVSSVITGLAELDAKDSGKMCTLATGWYVATTFLAVVTGICLVLFIHPGNPAIKQDFGHETASKQVNTFDTLLDLIRNMFPENIVQATFQQAQTKYVEVPVKHKNATSRNRLKAPAKEVKPVLEYSWGLNCLGLIVFSMAMGICMSQERDEVRVLAEFFKALDKVVMKLVGYVMVYSPIGIMCLVMGKILEIDDIAHTARMLALYMVTVMLGLIIHGGITLPCLYTFLTRKNPFLFTKGLLQAWVTAIGTGSSSATLPATMKCCEENLGIDKRVSRFVLPVGATINMDGTALYEAVAAIFIAQVNGIEMELGQVTIVCVTATLASIGAAAVPSAGLVTMLMVLSAVGLPLKDVSLIVAVDWLLDRFRTSINVIGDAYGAGVVHHFVKDQLAMADAEHHRDERNRPSSPYSADDALLGNDENRINSKLWDKNARTDHV